MFKVGDKVKGGNGAVHDYFPKGATGVIIDGTDQQSLLVRADIPQPFHDVYVAAYELVPQTYAFTGADIQNSGGGLRYDDGKAPMHLLCPVAMEGIANVMAAGAKKYAPHNWQKGMAWSKVIACLLRHTFALMRGEDLDKETGLPHVDHIGANAMFLCNYFRNHKALDDRYKVETDTKV